MESIDSDDKEGNADYIKSNLDSDRDDNDDVGVDKEYYNVKEGTMHNVPSSNKT
jgi:hypothetical protein